MLVWKVLEMINSSWFSNQDPNLVLVGDSGQSFVCRSVLFVKLADGMFATYL